MASVAVAVDLRALERVAADLAVVGVSPDDRPLRGAAGRADWRLCGDLWRLVTARKWNAARRDALLVSTAGALRSPLLLVIGLGPRAELVVERWSELGRAVAERALDLRARRAVLGLASDAANLGPDATRALLAGAVEAVAARGSALELVLAGDGAPARLAELRPLAAAGAPMAARLQLPAAADDRTRAYSADVGDIHRIDGIQFK